MIRIGSLFAGIGGLELGLQAGLELEGVSCQVVWQVEQDEYCRAVLAQHYPHAVRFEDVRQVNRHNLPPVDLICGGFPCQDISVAGCGAGLDGDRSGLYFDMLRIVCELQPRLWIMENVPAITHRGLDTVLRTMAKAGYHARWGCLRASALGAPHRRERWFCVGWMANTTRLHSNAGTNHTTESIGQKPEFRDRNGSPGVANTQRLRQYKPGQSNGSVRDKKEENWQADIIVNDIDRKSKSRVGGDADGFPSWLDIAAPKWPAPPGPAYEWEPPRIHTKQPNDRQRLKALGNSVVPAQAAVIGRWIASELLQPMLQS